MLNNTSASIELAIMENHTFDKYNSIPFITDKTTGFIPKSHLQTYLDTGLFIEVENDGTAAVRFSCEVNSFEDKTDAMVSAIDSLIENGLLEAVNVPHFQERAVGGDNRLENPEFKINRAYYRSFGFPSDAVFLNVFTGTEDDPKVLLQKRAGRVEFGNTYDFASGGAVKFPQKLDEAIEVLIKSEMGVGITDNVIFDGTVDFKFSDVDKEWVTNQNHNIFHLYVSEEDINIGQYDKKEVAGFEVVSIEDAIKMCATGEFNRQNTQAFMTSLFDHDLVPEFKNSHRIKDFVDQHFTSTSPSPVAGDLAPPLDELDF